MASDWKELKLGERDWSQLIVFDHHLGEFRLYPLTKSNRSLVTQNLRKACIDLKSDELPETSRMIEVQLPIPDSTETQTCFVFARVEKGCERKFELFVVNILNIDMYGRLEDKIEIYNDMVPLHPDVLLRDFKYSRRLTAQDDFIPIVRTVFDDDLKYESHAINFGSKVEVFLTVEEKDEIKKAKDGGEESDQSSEKLVIDSSAEQSPDKNVSEEAGNMDLMDVDPSQVGFPAEDIADENVQAERVLSEDDEVMDLDEMISLADEVMASRMESCQMMTQGLDAAIEESHKARKGIALNKKSAMQSLQEVLAMAQWPPSTSKRKDVLLRSSILQYLPIENIHQEGVDLLFSSPIGQEVIVQKVRQKLIQAGKDAPTENEVANVVLEMCFSDYLRAHCYWGEYSPQCVAGLAWDKIKLPETFVQFYYDVLLQMDFTALDGSGQRHKVKVAEKKAGKKSPPSSELANSRNSYYYWFGRDAESLGHWLRLRYNSKVEFVEKYFDEDREGRIMSIPTFTEENDMFLKKANKKTVSKGKIPKEQATLRHHVGKPFDKVDLRDNLIRLLRSGYGHMPPSSYNIAEYYITEGDFEDGCLALVNDPGNYVKTDDGFSETVNLVSPMTRTAAKASIKRTEERLKFEISDESDEEETDQEMED